MDKLQQLIDVLKKELVDFPKVFSEDSFPKAFREWIEHSIKAAEFILATQEKPTTLSPEIEEVREWMPEIKDLHELSPELAQAHIIQWIKAVDPIIRKLK